MSYKNTQKNKQIGLIKTSSIFNGDNAGGKYRGNSYPHILLDGRNNLFSQIIENTDIFEYFENNDISWWGGHNPTGNILSSQIACLNHLFLLRKNKEAVLKIAQTICPNFEDVMKITSDKFSPAYIAFEAVSNNDYLNECKDGQKPTRGNNCTSIDALIYARDKNGDKYILPIEWKYTEHYYNQDKSIEDSSKKEINHEKGDKKGKERLERYSDLINKSPQLKQKYEDYKGTIYFFEPFYQLMRQTLWAEQMIDITHKEIDAKDFIHVHVIPKGNSSLLEKSYRSNKKMEATWKDCLSKEDKYKIISPEELLATIDKTEYANLISYLSTRYWDKTNQ